jgi:lysophospholipase L1-like esterase
MKSLHALKRATIALSLAIGAATVVQAQVVRVEPPTVARSPEYVAALTRWQSSFSAFSEADKQKPPGTDGVLFVGSSTIRFWAHMAQDFRDIPLVINRGFGGSTMADCSLFAGDLVVRYKPRQVLVYAGDNDLAEGRTPLQVLESFANFANTVRAELPNTRISYISIKPSPSREALLPKIRETNNIISAYLRTLSNSEYIDIYTPMIGQDDRPRSELFLADRLHMNEAGYKLWQSVIASHLPAAVVLPQATASVVVPPAAPR